MGQIESKHSFAFNAKKGGGRGSKRGGGRGSKKGSKEQNEAVREMLQIPMHANALLRGKKYEAYASAFEKGTAGIKNLTGARNDFLNGQVERRELEANGKAYRESLLSIQTFSSGTNKMFQKTDWVQLFGTFLRTVELGVSILEVIYGSELEKIGLKIAGELEARTGLSAPEKFSAHVYKFISHHCNYTGASYVPSLRHVYFLYHPDTDWYPEFSELVQSNPLPASFLGMSENLDALVVWMKFLRLSLGKNSEQTVFHLIIPSYRHMLIKDPLEFPDLGLLVIHGEIHNAENYVLFNLPTIKEYEGGMILLKNITNIAREESEWKDVAVGGTWVGGVSASLAGTVGLAAACPPLAPLAVLGVWGGGLCATAVAAEKVEKNLSEEVPRVLGGREIIEANVQAEVGEGRESRVRLMEEESITVQPHTRHVHHRGRQASERRHNSRRDRKRRHR